jgi:hypothetical protein
VLRDVTAAVAAADGRVRLHPDRQRRRPGPAGQRAAKPRGAERALYEGEMTLDHFMILNRSDAVAVASGRPQLANEAQARGWAAK